MPQAAYEPLWYWQICPHHMHDRLQLGLG